MNDVSPLWIPLAGIMVAIVAVGGGILAQVHQRRLVADQRMALLARGMSLADIEAFFKASEKSEAARPVKDPMRGLGNARRAAVMLISTGVGLIAFFGLLALILHHREVWAGASTGVIPIAIGIGFVVDYQLQKREMSRFGLEIGG